MNTVSWFLYLADTLTRASSLLGFIAFFGFFASVALTIAGIFVRSGSYSWVTKQDREFCESIRSGCARAAKLSWPLVIVCAFVNVAIPSKDTMYAIAASQVGEQVVRSETVQGIATDATKALQQWIKRQVEPEKKS